MISSKEKIDKAIEEFKKRIETEKEFCQELYDHATERLMAHKYAYYTLAKEIVKDYAYDGEEEGWYIMGRALNLLKEDEISPCVDFDENHPFAERGKNLAKKLLKIK